MRSVNFEFLRARHRALADLAALCETYISREPSSAVPLQRLLLEHLVEEIAAGQGLAVSDRTRTWVLLSYEAFIQRVPDEIVGRLRGVESLTSAADAEGSRIDAGIPSLIMQELHSIAAWFHVAVDAGRPRDVKPFADPAQTDSDDADPMPLGKLRLLESKLLDELRSLSASRRTRPRSPDERRSQDRLPAHLAAPVAGSPVLNSSELREKAVAARLESAGWSKALTTQQAVSINGRAVRPDFALISEGETLAIVEVVASADAQSVAAVVAHLQPVFAQQHPLLFVMDGLSTWLCYSNGKRIVQRPIPDVFTYANIMRRHFLTKRRRELKIDDAALSSALVPVREHRDAVLKALAAVQDGHRAVLLRMSPGTGRSHVLVHCAIELVRSGWAERILHLCGTRVEMEQADLVFRRFAPSLRREIATARARSTSSNVYFCTYEDASESLEWADPGTFDLVTATDPSAATEACAALAQRLDAIWLGVDSVAASPPQGPFAGQEHVDVADGDASPHRVALSAAPAIRAYREPTAELVRMSPGALRTHAMRIADASRSLFPTQLEAAQQLGLLLLARSWEFRERNDPSRFVWSKVARVGPERLGIALQHDFLPLLNTLDLGPAFVRSRDRLVMSPRSAETESLLETISRVPVNTASDVAELYDTLLELISNEPGSALFTTPRDIVRTMVGLVRPRAGERVVDVACGTGGFLSRTIRLALRGRQHESVSSKNLPRVVGYDLDPNACAVAALRLALLGVDGPEIGVANTLGTAFRDTWVAGSAADVILVDPPLGDVADRSNVDPELLILANTARTDVLFVMQAIRLLKPGGRGAIVVREGVLRAAAKAYQQLRRFILQNTEDLGVLDVPDHRFKAGQTSVMVFTKGQSGHRTFFFRGPPERAVHAWRERDAASVSADRSGDAFAVATAEIENDPDRTLAPAFWAANESAPEAAMPTEQLLTRLRELQAENARALEQIEALMSRAPLQLFEAERSPAPAWRNETLGSLAELTVGSRLVGLARARALSARSMIAGGSLELGEWRPPMNVETAHNGDILMVCEGPPTLIGTTAVFTGALPRAFDHSLIRIRVGPRMVPEFVDMWLRSWDARRELQRMASQSALSRLRPDWVARLNIPVPPLDTQHGFAEAARVSRVVGSLAREQQHIAERLFGLEFRTTFSVGVQEDSDE